MRRHLSIFIRGMAMGAADLVPGVSGGTIALITGIYDPLLQAISSFNLTLLRVLKSDGLASGWRSINGSFLLALAAGIGTSIIGLSGILHHLLEHERTLLYAFFFGLVASSIPLIGREVQKWNGVAIGAFLFGAALTFAIGSLPPLSIEPGYLYLFGCGALAACAMILPGISGSFILLLLGVYSPVIAAIKSYDVVTVAVVGIGAITGLLGFSRLLRRWLETSRNGMMALLSGFLLGSLQALWPWKENAMLLYTHSDGRETWLQTNAWPQSEALWGCLIWTLVGSAIVIGMHRIAQPSSS